MAVGGILGGSGDTKFREATALTRGPGWRPPSQTEGSAGKTRAETKPVCVRGPGCLCGEGGAMPGMAASPALPGLGKVSQESWLRWTRGRPR